jgi:hypothetical protein
MSIHWGGRGAGHISRLPLGVGGFSPVTLFTAGEQGVWYDPSDITTLFQDTAGTTPVTTVGQTVALIKDKSGRGNNAIQATALNRPQYQVDGSGRPFLLFDGLTDGMATSSIVPGIDKVQVFTGVRKLSDLALGMVAETGTGGAAGSFFFAAPISASPDIAFRSTGTVSAIAQATGAVAPNTAVLTGLGDIAGDRSTLRINGAQVAQNTADQGTGNYTTQVLYVGRRSGTLFPFNGRIYQMIVRFGANMSASTITDTETYVNLKTGAY